MPVDPVDEEELDLEEKDDEDVGDEDGKAKLLVT